MARGALRICTWVSGAMLVAVLALWARSCWRSDSVAYLGAGGTRAIQSYRGLVIIGTDNIAQAAAHFEQQTWVVTGARPVGWPKWPGFSREETRTVTSSLPAGMVASMPGKPPAVIRSVRFTFPMWGAAIVAGALPAWRATRWALRRRGPKVGMCIGCGYDLRATPERCPECGREAGDAPG